MNHPYTYDATSSQYNMLLKLHLIHLTLHVMLLSTLNFELYAKLVGIVTAGHVTKMAVTPFDPPG